MDALVGHALFQANVNDPTVKEAMTTTLQLLQDASKEHDFNTLIDLALRDLEECINATPSTIAHYAQLIPMIRNFRDDFEMLFPAPSPSKAHEVTYEFNQQIEWASELPLSEPYPTISTIPKPQTIVRCDVCYGEESYADNRIVICDECEVAVHELCYNISRVPDTAWYCLHCTAQKTSLHSDIGCCSACNQLNGALVPTTNGKWVHMACTLYLPELYFIHEKVDGLDLLKARRKLKCVFCKKVDDSACAQCSFGKCTTSYHVMCALKQGVQFVLQNDQTYVSMCKAHQEPKQQSSNTSKPTSKRSELVQTTIQTTKLKPSPPVTPAKPSVDTSTIVKVPTLKAPRLEYFQTKLVTPKKKLDKPKKLEYKATSSVFDCPIFEPIIRKRGEYVMCLVPMLPLGIEFDPDALLSQQKYILECPTEPAPHGVFTLAFTQKYLERGDELCAINSMPMHNISPTHMRDEILPQCQFPIQCWFKKKIPFPSALPNSNPEPNVKIEPVVKAEPVEVNSNEEWPWCYLRSDGKLAMPQVWRVFDEMYHSKEIDTSALLESLKSPESLYVIPPLGYLDIPDVIYDHRKQLYAAQSAQNLTALPPLEVGTMVNVAKRTWPGINKLGGTGRIKARREGENGVFTYDVTYVLGGRENQIDRQYITPVTLDDPIGTDQKKEANSDNTLAWSLQGAFIVKELSAIGNEESFKVSFSVDAESDKIEQLHPSTESGTVKASFRLDSVVDVLEEHIPDEIGPQLHVLQDQLRQIDISSKEAFEKLTKLLENEKKQAYFTAMQELTNKEYEEMYRKMMVLHEEHFGPVNPPVVKSKKTVAAENKPAQAEDDEEDDSDEDVDLPLFITAKQEESSAVCCLCQLPGGDLAATSCGQVAHIMCLLYTPETYFDDNLGHGIADVTPERLGLTCEICKGKRGVNKLQCANKKCTKSFHVQCAYVRGQLTTYPSFTGWCAKHLKKADAQVQASIDWPPHIKKQLIKEGKLKENDTSLLPPPPDPSLIPPHKREAAKEKKKPVNRKRKPDVVTQVKAQQPSPVKEEPVTTLVKQEFNVGDTVRVQERTWSGINKPGGVGRIKKKHVSHGDIVTYDIDYVLGGGEKGVESFYVFPVDLINEDTGKKRRRANYTASYECE